MNEIYGSILEWIGKCVPHLFATLLLFLTACLKSKKTDKKDNGIIKKIVNYEYFLSLACLNVEAILSILKKQGSIFNNGMKPLTLFYFVFLTMYLLLLLIFVYILYRDENYIKNKIQNILKLYDPNNTGILMVLLIVLTNLPVFVGSFFSFVILGSEYMTP